MIAVVGVKEQQLLRARYEADGRRNGVRERTGSLNTIINIPSLPHSFRFVWVAGG